MNFCEVLKWLLTVFFKEFLTCINENNICSIGIFPCPMLIGSHFGLCLIFNEEKWALKSLALNVIWWEQGIGDNVHGLVLGANC